MILEIYYKKKERKKEQTNHLTLSKVIPINGGGGQIIEPIRESQEESKIFIF